MKSKTASKSAKKFYVKWSSLKDRTENKKCTIYTKYGKRGIKNSWKDFLEFKRDMYKKYLAHVRKHGLKDTTLDRINNDDGYSKSNCRWATRTEQSQNRKKFLKSEKSPFTGVRKREKGFQATLKIGGKVLTLGTFSTAIKAAKIYDKFARKYYGKYAHTNF